MDLPKTTEISEGNKNESCAINNALDIIENSKLDENIEVIGATSCNKPRTTDSHIMVCITTWTVVFKDELELEQKKMDHLPKDEDGNMIIDQEEYQAKFPLHALIEKFSDKSLDAIDHLRRIQNNNILEAFQTEEMLEVFREELGQLIDSNEDCLAVMERFQEYAKDEPEILEAIDNIITFLNLPDGTFIPEHKNPINDIRIILEWSDVELDQLIQCARYIKSSSE